MKLKPDFTTWLHAYRARELTQIFADVPDKYFECALEIGAGDGFQSVLLSRYVRRLRSTEVRQGVLPTAAPEGIEFLTMPARKAVWSADAEMFDLVFSSNVLEHCVDPCAILGGIHRCLKNNGVTIHVLPTSWWKVCQLALYLPVRLLIAVERITREPGFLFCSTETGRLIRDVIRGCRDGNNHNSENDGNNNPEISRKKPSFLYRLFLPSPHGISKGHIEEFCAFLRKRWIREFQRAGFRIVAVRPGPPASGYGLGWRFGARIAQMLGLVSEIIIVAVKKDSAEAYREAASFF